MLLESPGNLPSIVRLDNMRYVHFSRNPIIAKFLKVHKFVREFGEGVDRMYRELQEAGNPSPKYEQIAFMIVGTAYSSMFAHSVETEGILTETMEETEKDLEKISENQRKILELMRLNPYITQEELSRKIGINSKNIRNNIIKLKNAGLITRIGPDKGGRWQVNEIEEGKYGKGDRRIF